MAIIAGEKLGVEIEEGHIKTWDFHETIDSEGLKDHVYGKMKEEGWCLNLEVFPGAIEGVQRLQEIAEVFFVTSPFDSPFWEYERRLWLKNHFRIDRKHVLQGDAKFLVRGELFIDDKPDHIHKWLRYMPGRGHALLWDRPHNASSTLDRVSSWEEVERYLRDRWVD
jgi:5'(3')-deoxyribonucleotidase